MACDGAAAHAWPSSCNGALPCLPRFQADVQCMWSKQGSASSWPTTDSVLIPRTWQQGAGGGAAAAPQTNPACPALKPTTCSYIALISPKQAIQLNLTLYSATHHLPAPSLSHNNNRRPRRNPTKRTTFVLQSISQLQKASRNSSQGPKTPPTPASS